MPARIRRRDFLRQAAAGAAVAGENIIALCDVDENRLGAAAARFPAARKYPDGPLKDEYASAG